MTLADFVKLCGTHGVKATDEIDSINIWGFTKPENLVVDVFTEPADEEGPAYNHFMVKEKTSG